MPPALRPDSADAPRTAPGGPDSGNAVEVPPGPDSLPEQPSWLEPDLAQISRRPHPIGLLGRFARGAAWLASPPWLCLTPALRSPLLGSGLASHFLAAFSTHSAQPLGTWKNTGIHRSLGTESQAIGGTNRTRFLCLISLASLARFDLANLLSIKDNGLFRSTRHSGYRALLLARFTIYVTRFASHLAMNGVDLTTIKELMRHKSYAMTLRYAHLSNQHTKHAVDRLSFHTSTVETEQAQ